MAKLVNALKLPVPVGVYAKRAAYVTGEVLLLDGLLIIKVFVLAPTTPPLNVHPSDIKSPPLGPIALLTGFALFKLPAVRFKLIVYFPPAEIPEVPLEPFAPEVPDEPEEPVAPV